MVLVGGGSTPTSAFQRFIELAGGQGKARIGIITAASKPESQDPNAGTSKASNSRTGGQYYVDRLTTLGAAEARWIEIDFDLQANNASPTIVALIKTMSGFWFGPGDQSRLMSCLRSSDGSESPALAAIRAAVRRGAAVGGTSAGTAAQPGPPMVTGGESYEALVHGAHTDPSVGGWKLTCDKSGGLGLFGYGLLDTHVSARGRQGRMLRLAAHAKRELAFGVDERTGLVVTGADSPQAKMEVIGEGGVTILDLAGATSSTAGGQWSIEGTRLSYLTRGDLYLPAKRTVKPASWKTSLAGKESGTAPIAASSDVFSSRRNTQNGERKNPRELTELAIRLADHQSATVAKGQTFESAPTFSVKLHRESGSTEAYRGVSGATTFFSVVNLRLEISELQPRP
jgi:cyanophycinase